MHSGEIWLKFIWKEHKCDRRFNKKKSLKGKVGDKQGQIIPNEWKNEFVLLSVGRILSF